MNTLDLIEILTWAIIEVQVSDGKPDLHRVGVALQAALEQALLAKEQQIRLQATIVRTAKVCDSPDVSGIKMHEGGAL